MTRVCSSGFPHSDLTSPGDSEEQASPSKMLSLIKQAAPSSTNSLVMTPVSVSSNNSICSILILQVSCAFASNETEVKMSANSIRADLRIFLSLLYLSLSLTHQNTSEPRWLCSRSVLLLSKARGKTHNIEKHMPRQVATASCVR